MNQDFSKMPGSKVPWVQNSRSHAYRLFRQQTSQTEEFRFTKPSFSTAVLPANSVKSLSYRLECSNPSGVIVSELEQSLESKQFNWEKYWPVSPILNQDYFTTYIQMDWREGLIVRLKANLSYDQPVYLKIKHSNVLFTCFRILIIAEENCHCNVVVEFENDGESAPPYSTEMPLLGLVQFYGESGSQCQMHLLPSWNLRQEFFIRHVNHLENDTKLDLNILSLGGLKGQYRMDSFLQKERSHLTINGAMRGDQHQHLEFCFNAHHLQKNTSSGLNWTMVMAGDSRGIMNGCIRIGEKGSRTKAHQHCKSVMLSRNASTSALPKLEIETDDVEVSHGVTVCSIDESQLFYLATRGIALEDAKQMIVEGYTRQILEKIPLVDLRQKLESILNQKKDF